MNGEVLIESIKGDYVIVEDIKVVYVMVEFFIGLDVIFIIGV